MTNPNNPVIDRGIEPQVRKLHAQGRPMPRLDDDRSVDLEGLIAFAKRVQEVLFLDVDYIGDYWNADKEWSPDTLDAIGNYADEYGLRPKYGDYHLPEA